MGIIPNEPQSYPIPSFDRITMLIFGSPGSGKTTFCAGAPGTMFFATEPGTQFLTAAVVRTYNWDIFRGAVDELEAMAKGGNAPYGAYVIDIVDNLSTYCRDWVCAKRGLAYPPTNDFGKTWSEVTKEWQAVMRRLMTIGAVRFITHCTTQSVEVAADNGAIVQIDRFVPTFSGSKPAQYLDGIVHVQGYCAVNKRGQHVITFAQSASVAAKDRTGLLAGLGVLPLDWTAVDNGYRQRALDAGKIIIEH